MPGAEFAATTLRVPPVGAIFQYLRLAADMARRDLRDRYAGALLGLGWLALTPAAYLAIYWFVFGNLLGVTWGGRADALVGRDAGFLLPFFAGLVTYLFAVELLISSTDVFARRRDYVRRAPFPIWVLWLANLLRTAVPAAANLAILLALAAVQGRLTLAGLAWLAPAVAPSLLLLTALSLVLALLGPFLGDLQEGMRVITRVLFYAAPISYPLAIVPEHLRGLLWLNPLTQAVESLRNAVVFGSGPELLPWVAIAVAAVGLTLTVAWLYRRVAGTIADVV